MSSNLKVNSLVPATGTEIGIGTTGGSIDFRCAATFGGNVTIGGTLTYDEVINIDSIGIVTARSGLNVQAGQLDVGSNIKLGNAGVITATSFVGSGANLTSLPAQATIANNADNRVITGGSGVNLNGESNLTFDGAKLNITTNSAGFRITRNSQYLELDANSGNGGDQCVSSSANFRIQTGGVGNSFERVRILSTGDVVINRTSALNTSKFSLTKDADQQAIGVQLNQSSGITTSLAAYNSSGTNIFDLAHDTDNTPDLLFKLKHSSDAAPVEKVRITSDGNVLVGTTDNAIYNNGDSASEGIVLRNGEVIDIARKGDLQLTLNRQTNDGPHIAFYRSGAAKHFISTFDNDLVFEVGGSSSGYRKHRFTSTGDILLGAHGSRIFDDSSGTNVVVDIYGGTTAGKRGILALGGRTGSDDADIGTIQFVNENNNVATAANHNQSKLVSSIHVKSETSDGNAGSDSGGHLIFSTKPETGQLTERLRIKSDGDIVATGNLKTNNLPGRNIVINGDMRVAQRSTSASMSSSGNDIPACDRWQYNRNGPSSTVAQVAEAPAGSGFKYSLKWTNTSPVGSIAAGNVVKFSYGIERQDIQRLGYGNANGKKATLSFWAKGSISGKIGVACTRDSRIFSANEDIVANTWKFVEITIPVDASTGFSGDDNANGFNFGICWGAGSNSTSGAVGSWINFHNAYSAGFTAGQQGAYLTTNGSTFQITGVQLEIGSQSTPFEHCTYAEQLKKCERYFQCCKGPSLVDTGDNESLYGIAFAYTTSRTLWSFIFKTEMRDHPTIAMNTISRLQGLGVVGGWNSATSLVYNNKSSKLGCRVDLNWSGTPFTAGHAVEMRITGDGLLSFNADFI